MDLAAHEFVGQLAIPRQQREKVSPDDQGHRAIFNKLDDFVVIHPQ